MLPRSGRAEGIQEFKFVIPGHKTPKGHFKMKPNAADYPAKPRDQLHSLYLIFVMSVISEFVSFMLFILNSNAFLLLLAIKMTP